MKTLRTLSILTVSLLSPLLTHAQTEPPKTGVEVVEIYLAKDDGKGDIGEIVESFQTTDSRIYCVVQLSSDKGATVKMNFVAVEVSGVKPSTNVVTTSYTTKDGEDRVSFYGKPKTKWTAGKYRVDISVDGKLIKTLPFDIKGTPAAAGSQFVEPTPKPKPAPIRKPKND